MLWNVLDGKEKIGYGQDVSEEQSLFVCLKRCTKATQKLYCAFSPIVNKYSIFSFTTTRKKWGELGGGRDRNVYLCCTYAVEFIWSSENSLWESVLPFHHVSSWDRTLVVKFDSKHLFLPNLVLQAPGTHFLDLTCVFESTLILEFSPILQVSSQITLRSPRSFP